ncbi:non-hydrolyzing UDP-N-acetylglucosamine 2-epimerase [Thermoproteota archaeon]
MSIRRILVAFGTRPEAVKLAPLILGFRTHPDRFEVKLCVTAQHRDMLDQVLEFFDLVPDYDLNVMKVNQSLFDVHSECMKALEGVIKEYQPEMIVVQGDTTTAFLSALSGYYFKIPVCHIEAGLRTYDKFNPFPEEMNRRMISQIADIHFVPTKNAEQNLAEEGIISNVYIVGNTVIDALIMGLKRLETEAASDYQQRFSGIDYNKQILLVTMHRRESFGEPLEEVCHALKDIADTCSDVHIVYPVHANPNVRDTVFSLLKDVPNITLLNPVSYPELLWLMKQSKLILTDSGGIQEEAPTLGKPVIVLRSVTERQEGLDAGTAVLAGTDKKRIMSIVLELLVNPGLYESMAQAENPYGDGHAVQRIMDILSK